VFHAEALSGVWPESVRRLVEVSGLAGVSGPSVGRSFCARPETPVFQTGDSGTSFLQRLVSRGHYIKPTPTLEKTTMTRNILPPIVASSNFLDLSSYPLLAHALLGFG
jgi:hypothetical protein